MITRFARRLPHPSPRPDSGSFQARGKWAATMKGPLSLDRCWGRAGRLLTVPSASGFSPSTWASEALGPGSRAAEVGSARGAGGSRGRPRGSALPPSPVWSRIEGLFLFFFLPVSFWVWFCLFFCQHEEKSRLFFSFSVCRKVQRK